ncbi:MAG TPA: substrate-binding domain-containing protein [Solirubrobacteraceae bacterium]|nr:substrate-binding domain-containing protein [Solirubrobacteraceae bacterium]
MRRLLAVPLLGLVTAGMLLLLSPALALAQTTLTVVGTSDVSDSGLVPNLVKPEFQAAYPQYTLNYVGSATGVAIQSAESGNGSPSALIVHAASLENQFVAGGYSYQNKYGNAIFTNDFVLAGPTSDPAGVGTNGANNIAQAFADIASAGAAGNATFLSRGGTNTAPGTTVEEHEIWGLVQSSGLQPASLSLCVVSAADGGGMAPVNTTALNGQPCPDSGAIIAGDGHNPSWYQITGVNQGKNVQEANSCTGQPSPPGTCYVLTDRGTYDYLSSGTDPAGTIPNLKIVTRGPQSAGAPGGADALINYFHVYIINPNKPGEDVNLQGAEDFVNFLTSPSFQAQLKDYLANTSDPAGPPFVATASPHLTASGFPKNYHVGKPATVSGQLTNAEVGYPALAGKTVTIDEVKGALVIPVASGTTNSTGHYTIKFIPPATGSYEATTAQISQIENATLNPIYGDLLSPAATTPVKVTVHTAITGLHATSQGGKALVFGKIQPGTGHGAGTVTVLARTLGKKGSFRKVASERVGSSQANFAVSAPLRRGDWQVEATFSYPGGVAAGSSTVNVSVGAAPTSSVSFRSIHAKKGKLTVSAAVAPAPGPSGGKVVILGLNTAPGAPARLTVLGHATVGVGDTTVTLHVKAKRKVAWLLQLAYTQPGQASSFSKLRPLDVK